MTKLCKNCGTKEISDKATFCGDACRKAFSRKSDTTDNKSDNSDTIKSDILPTRTKSDTQPEQITPTRPEQTKSDTFIPNWQRIGLEADEVKAYIVWHLKKSGILDHSVISIGNRMFGNYKERAKELKGDVKEFRASV